MLPKLRAELRDALSRRNIVANGVWLLLLAAFNVLWPVVTRAVSGVSLWYLVPLGIAGFLAVAALVLWRSDKARPATVPVTSPSQVISPPTPPHIEPEDSQQWGGRSSYVQHILVTNPGAKATFKASVTRDISGLDKSYGKALRIVWEQPYDEVATLGRDEQGRLRFAEFERDESGQLIAWFFPVPTRRHSQAKTGYLKTQPFEVAADSMSFEFCVRNVDSDLVYRRYARISFDPDAKPRLEIHEGAPEPLVVTTALPSDLSKLEEIRRAALPLMTELRDIQRKIELVRSTGPHPHYSNGFRFPGFRWDQYHELLTHEPDLYRVVESAYAAAHRTNEVLAFRQTRAKPGATLAETSDENLDDVGVQAAAAIKALEAIAVSSSQTEADHGSARAHEMPAAGTRQEREVDGLLAALDAARARVVLRGSRTWSRGLGTLSTEALVIAEARTYIGHYGTPSDGDGLREVESRYRGWRTPEAQIERIDALRRVLVGMKKRGAP